MTPQRSYRKNGFALLVVLVVLSFWYLGRAARHPTQEEWLEVYTAHHIHQLIDLWEQRISVRVVVASKSNGKPLTPREIVVTLTEANGQEPLSQAEKDEYVRRVRELAESLLKDYRVVRAFKVTVQFV